MKLRNLRKAALLFALLSSLATVQAVVFTNDTIIGFQDQTYDNTDVVVSNCTLTVDGSHTFASVRVAANGVLTHSPASNGWLQASLYVNDEPLVLNGLNAVTLSNACVDLGWLELRDASTNFFNIVADYVVSSVAGGLTAIQRSTNSTIPDGAIVFATYRTYGIPSGLSLSVSNDVEVEPGGAIHVDARGYAGGSGAGAGRYAGYPICGGGGGYGGNGGMGTNPPGSYAITNRAAGGASYGFFTTPNDKGSGGGRGFAGAGGSGGGLARLNIGGTCRLDGAVTANGQDATNSRSGGGSGGGIWISAQTFAGSGTLSANGGRGEPVYGGGGGGGRVAIFCQTNTFAGALSAMGGRGAQYGGAGTVFLETRIAGGPILTQRLLIQNSGVAGALTPLTDTANYPRMDLSVLGGSQLGVLSSLNLGNLFIASNSWVSNISGALPKPTMSFTMSSHAVIEAGGGVAADGCGQPAMQGSGAGRTLIYYPTPGSPTLYLGGGGGYGGFGAASVHGAEGGASYGSPTDTTLMPGSGGGGSVTAGGAGGGTIRFSVTGDLTLNGTIKADGAAAPGQHGGGGSGGGIAISARNVSGNGTVSVLGGAGNALGGGGGGGRVTIQCQTNTFSGQLRAWGGSGGNTGGAGTIYSYLKGSAQLLVDNGGRVGTNTPLNYYGSSGSLIVRGGAVARLTGGSSFYLSSLLIASNSWLQMPSSSYSVVFNITSNAVIEAGGGILANGMGYSANMGPGSGRWLMSSSTGSGGGGGNGGNGAASALGAAGGNATSGTLPAPGSGGGSSALESGSRSGAGGGALQMTVGKTLLLDGSIMADGNAGTVTNSGGGSGGGVRITAATLSGSGGISACGGNGNLLGGGGGGGIISISSPSNNFAGVIRAWGGDGANVGGAGLITIAGSQQTVTIADNGGRAGMTTPLTSSALTWSGSLVVRGGAVARLTGGSSFYLSSLLIASNSWLQMLPGSFSVVFNITSNVVIEAGGGISADGAGYGANQGSGMGQWLVVSSNASFSSGGGGGKCGFGAASSLGAAGGNAWDTSIGSTAGSGGGASSNSPIGDGLYRGGAGGGGMILTVGRTCLINGILSADGNRGAVTNGGGGSGGGIQISASLLTGSGIISACGGDGHALGGGGGGGCIRIQGGTNLFTGILRAFGGDGARVGGAGLIVQSPRVIADNGGRTGTNTIFGFSSRADSLVIRGGAVVQPTQTELIYLADLLIASSSCLQMRPLTYGVSINVLSNLVVEAGAGIRADGMGYGAGLGPGAGQWLSRTPPASGGGGGNAGFGAASALGALGGNAGAYVNTFAPGSGGGSDTLAVGSREGAGGGFLNITVGKTFLLDGYVSANGNRGSTNGGGGSGGGIRVGAATLSGSGLFSVCGGEGNSLGGGGGGGYLNISSKQYSFTGLMRAWGGGGVNAGGAGLITIGGGTQTGQMIMDNGGLSGTNTPLPSNVNTPVFIRGGAVVQIPSGFTSFSFPSLSIESNGWLQLPPSTSFVQINSTNISIASGGGILGDGMGYPFGQGPHPGRWMTTQAGASGGGGGNGGCGAASSGGVSGGLSGNSVTEVPQPGSGGGGITIQNPRGSAGGAALQLTAPGSLVLDGLISANGNPGYLTNGGTGGGAGGSILISCGSISGSGLVSVCGGAGQGQGGGGGGGRVRIISNTNDFLGTIRAYGGWGTNIGGAGTICRQARKTEVIVDNGGRIGNDTWLTSSGLSYGLIISNGASLVPDMLSLESLRVCSNSWIKQQSNAYVQIAIQSCTVIVQGDALIEAGAGWLADGRGYGSGSGSGRGYAFGDGGGYGGCGGINMNSRTVTFNSGAAYGLPWTPSSLGSGGGVSPTSPKDFMGGTGGGMARLIVNGHLTLDGFVSANGMPGTGGAGGGSGGSIWITAGNLSGSGRITADGGGGLATTGGGGGGRIAIESRTNLFSGPVTAFGGIGQFAGGAGTLCLRNLTNQLASLLLDNGGISGAVTPVYQSANPYDLFITSGAAGCMGSQERWIRLNNLFVEDGGAFSCLPLLNNQDLVVRSNVVISADSCVVVDGHGYPRGQGPGAGHAAFGMGSGGGYGGAGGSVVGAAGGITYGSALMPADSGSGGGVYTTYIDDGSQGGGVIRFNIGGTLQLDGRISSDGNPGYNDNSGGGAGGSIWITTDTLTGAGTISASGGMGEPYDGAGGGGGRIAVYARKAGVFSGSVHAWGGEGSAWGDDGTVFFSGFPGLNVITQSPAGALGTSVSFIDLTFNAAYDTASLTNLMVTLATPAGSISSFTVSQPGATALRIGFPIQTNGGLYTLSLSGLRDLTGRTMTAYTGSFSIVLPVISGLVLDSGGHPVPQTTLQAVCSGVMTAPVLTDGSGRYSITIPLDSSPVITPQKEGWVFTPPSTTYPNLVQSCINQDYRAAMTLAPATGSGSGQASALSWQGIEGIQYQLMVSSNLVDWIPCGPSVMGTNGPVTIPNAPNVAPSQFYRVHVVE